MRAKGKGEIIRLPQDVIDYLDELLHHLELETPHTHLTHGCAIRYLIDKVDKHAVVEKGVVVRTIYRTGDKP